MKKIIFFVTGFLLPVLYGFAQDNLPGKTVTGIILSAETHESLAGTTILLKNSHTSTITDKAGRFTIELPMPTDTLFVSHIGFQKQSIAVNRLQNAPLTILMKKKTTQLQGVVASTGYQRIPKERATGSFTFIDNELLNKQVGTNILDRLVGVTSGVMAPHKIGAPKLMVRGLSTLNGPKNPLIVVDNFPYEGDISNINPQDIESITILKDAAAASIWGTRAGNGVIVITTKRAKFNQHLKLAVNANVSITQEPDLYYLPKMSSSDYIDVEQFLFSKGFYNYLLTNPFQKAVSPVVDILDKKKKGILTAVEANAQIDKFRKYDVREDYDKYIYQNALLQQYSLNLSGGSNKMSYYIFGGYDKNINELAAEHNRLNLHIKNSYRPLKGLLINMGVAYTSVKVKSGKPAYNSIKIADKEVPYLRFIDDQGNQLPLSIDYRKSYTDTAGGGRLLDWNYYPLEDYKHNTTQTTQNDLLATLDIRYRIMNGLNLSVTYQYEKQGSNTNNLADIDSYKARNMINTYTAIDPITGIISYPLPMGGILNTSDQKIESQNIRGQINFNHTWGDHQIVAIAGAEVREIHSKGNSHTIYGYDKDVLNTSGVDYDNTYPSFVTGYSLHIPYGLSLNEKLNRFVSYYMNVAYTYKNRYIASISGRKDASNLFGLKTNEKWEPFWSAGFSWRVSDESFYKLSFLPYLKARITYGFSGNVDQSMSAVTTIINTGNAYTDLRSAKVRQVANPELRWETVNTINAGVDFSFKGGFLSGSIDYFIKKGSNLFGPAPLDYTTGLGRESLIKNVAAMRGNGIDLVLKAREIDRAFKWNTSVLFHYYMSKTTDFYRATKSASALVKNGNTISAIKGKPLYAIVSYKWGGLDPTNGNPRGYVDNKLSTDYHAIISSDRGLEGLVYGGPSIPPYYGSIMNTFSWKGITLSANIIYKLAYHFRKNSVYYSSLFNYGINHSDFEKRWKKPGDELTTDVPSLIYPLPYGRDDFYYHSEVTVRNASQIRLQFISLSYDLNEQQISRTPLNSFRVYLNCSNIGILWRANDEEIDPDYTSSIPPSLRMAIGIKCTF